jgi:hypothetical protein
MVTSQLSEGDLLILRTVEVPQANDLDKVFRVAILVSRGAATPEEVATGLDVVEREGAYYLAAARAMRVVRVDHRTTPTGYMLGYLGEDYLAASGKKRAAIIIQGTLAAPHVVYVAERLGLSTPLSTPTPRELHDVGLVERELATLGELSGTTPRRRAGTLVAWMKAVDKLARQA